MFVYQLQVLPSPSPTIVEKYETIVQRFLWKGKKPKIQTSILQNAKLQGGLNLVNLGWKDISLKSTWILRTEAIAQVHLKQFCPPELGELFWDCTINPEDLEPMLRTIDIDSFWKDCARSWFQVTWHCYEQEEPQNPILWFNSFIKQGSQTFFCPTWCKAGCVYLSDIMKPSGEFLDFPSIQQKYGKGLNWLSYMALCKAIPDKWLKLEVAEEIKRPYALFFSQNKKSKISLPHPPSSSYSPNK